MSSPSSFPAPAASRSARSSRLLELGLLALGLSLSPLPVHASDPRCDVTGNLVDVRVLVGGRPTSLFEAPGRADRRYFEAVKGRNYALAIRNNSGERVGVLITVDGLNVVDGERSSLGNHEAMYVLDPWEEAEVRGWRTSLSEVRRFVFVDEQRSYAERSGQANGDMGWIRVLAFREDGRRWRRDVREPGSREETRSGHESAAPGAPPATASPVPSEAGQSKAEAEGDLAVKDQRHGRDESNPGTGWGERSRDVVQRTSFRPEPSATDRVTLRYEYASGLQALGIDCRPRRDRLRERENGDLGFAQPPRW